ncbi:MAG: glycerol-3-phosphate 1-O-acyltransferase PlsY [Gemmatimonadetes bacterium]|nr:glycerol-3-phosphate 1-O-acyltransferase PlsY [Gemmatimonadota bacterium]
MGFGPSEIILVLGSYLIGAIPFAYIVTKLFMGIDIRTVGSKNVGFSNVYRIVGPGPGVLVLIGDIGKGALAVWLARRMGGADWVLVLAGLLAVVGHSWTVFLSFKGGKGVATACGVLFSLMPVEGLVAVGIFVTLVALSRMISLGSMVAAATLPFVHIFASLMRGTPISTAFLAFCVITAALVLVRHRANFTRILSGTETKFEFKPERGGGES